jgi:hypothetical protein
MSDQYNVRLESVKKIDSGININNISSSVTKSLWTDFIDQDQMVSFAKDVIKNYEASKGITEEEFRRSELVYLGAHSHVSMFKALTHINVSIIESILLSNKSKSIFIGSAFTNFAAMASVQPEALYGLNTQQTEYANIFFGDKIPEINLVTHQSLINNEFVKTFDASIIRFDYVSFDLLLLNSIINSTADNGLIIIPGSSDQGRLYQSQESLSYNVHNLLNEKCKSVCHLPVGTGITIGIL